MYIYVAGKRINLDPSKAIGKGGEADIYDIGGNQVLKLFKEPTHPDYVGNPDEQRAAAERIQIHQHKLKEFPKHLPGQVIGPQDLATDRSGIVRGYTMRFLSGTEPLLRYSDRKFRQTVNPNDVRQLYSLLWTAVDLLHKQRIVIGDFHDLNILVERTSHAQGPHLHPHIIDADSFQFGQYLCRTYTEKFVDPLLCDPKGHAPTLAAPHTPSSDWYAFAVMLLQGLLFVGPYGGVYRPNDSKRIIPEPARPLRRITIFHPEVRYPKPAIPYGLLPDDLLDVFHRVFEKDVRGEFPLGTFEHLHWTKCSACGTEHARQTCPHCKASAPVKASVAIKGTMTATTIFKTRGQIVCTTVEDGKLLWLYHENGEFRRESRPAWKGQHLPSTRYRLCGDKTLYGTGGMFNVIDPRAPAERVATDSYGPTSLPTFDANDQHWFWAANGQLHRNGLLGHEYIGDVLAGQTRFWVGPKFGFGFYRAGDLSIAFVFDATKRGLNDTIKLPRIRGEIVDATCVFAGNGHLAWFFVASKECGKIIHRCLVVRDDGAIIGTAEDVRDSGAWLGTIRGKCAAGTSLFSATDDGLIRVDIQNGAVLQTRSFPDTEPWVDSQSDLAVTTDGIAVIRDTEIIVLRMK